MKKKKGSEWIEMKNPLSLLIDIIYPPRCLMCRKFSPYDEISSTSNYLCSDCSADLNPITNPLCTVCGVPFSSPKGENHLCENCIRKKPYYELARAPYLYSGKLKNAIQRFKYNSETHLNTSLGGLLLNFVQKIFHKLNEYIIIPVPLHKRKLRERGYNQSLLLAKSLSRNLDVRLDYLSFTRKRYTLNQAGLRRKERKTNVKNAFSVMDIKAVEDRKILLIDDVFTTGYTLNECARTLKKSGAAEVICITLARTSFD